MLKVSVHFKSWEESKKFWVKEDMGRVLQGRTFPY